MVRTQISLSNEQYRFLKVLSQESGDSMAELIRRAVEELREPRRRHTAQAIELLGAFEADRDDVSVCHDAYFPEETGR